LLVICPNPHSGAPARPSTFEVLRVKEYIPIAYPFVIFTFVLAVESIKEFGGVSFRFQKMGLVHLEPMRSIPLSFLKSN